MGAGGLPVCLSDAITLVRQNPVEVRLFLFVSHFNFHDASTIVSPGREAVFPWAQSDVVRALPGLCCDSARNHRAGFSGKVVTPVCSADVHCVM